MAQELTGARPAQVDHGHVVDVEHGIATHLVVLFDLRTVVDRHVPAAEVDSSWRAERAMGVVEEGLLGHGGLGRAKKRIIPERTRAVRRHHRP